MSANLFIISAASGTGKTSLVSELLKSVENLTVSVSHTTRNPRPGEVDGDHYHFIDTKTFEEHIKNGHFLEHAQVFDNYYGTLLQTVEAQLSEGVDVILEIDWQGAEQVAKRLPDAISIFILPPSLQTLHHRLSNRGQDSDEVIQKRLAGSILEMTQHQNFDYLVINDEFEVALRDLQSIIRSARLKTARQRQYQAALIDALIAE